VLAVLALLFSSACDEPEPASAPPPAEPAEESACDAPFREDAAREARVRDLLASVAETERLARARATFCFGVRDISVVTTDAELIIDGRPDDREVAARVAHLLHHVVDGYPMTDEPGGDCGERVETALDREASALALELRTRRALDVTDPRTRFDFEESYFSLDEPEATESIDRYLHEHPTGGPGVEGLAIAYRERCEALD
jgi:hypothetical protein